MVFAYAFETPRLAQHRSDWPVLPNVKVTGELTRKIDKNQSNGHWKLGKSVTGNNY